MHIAIILPRWVGDAAMATPLLRAVRTHFAGTRITGVMRPVIADLLAGSGWFDDVIGYDRHGRNPSLRFRAAAWNLRAARADLALVLPTSLSAAALAVAGGVRQRVGRARGWQRLLFTDVVTEESEIVPPPAAYMNLAAAVGVPRGSLDLDLATTPADERAADAVLDRLFPGRGGPLVVLNDNSSNGPGRSWGVEKHGALARWLVERMPGCRVLVHCGPADRAQARAVVAAADMPAVRGLGDVEDLPLGLSKAIYRRARLAVTSDSGPRHIAAAFGVPTVALIGPTDPRLGRSDPRRCAEIRLDLPCSPCDRGTCPLGHHDCMRLLEVEQVGRAALRMLQQSDATLPVGRAG
jgi:heptosyltransferase-2